MNFWSRFRQNSFQIFLLLWGSILHFLLTGVYTYLYIAGGDFPVHYAVAPFLQILNFLGFHFLFSWVYRTLPWKKVGKMVLFAELFWVIIPIVLETVLLYLYHIPTNSSFLAVILASPFRESQEYMSASPTTIYGILVLLLGITAALSYWGTRFLSAHRKFWQKKKRITTGTKSELFYASSRVWLVLRAIPSTTSKTFLTTLYEVPTLPIVCSGAFYAR